MKQFAKALQNEEEFARFVAVLRREGVTSYLEIGSKWGGSLWRVGNALPKGSRLVAVDLPWGDGRTEPHLQECAAALRERGQDVTVIIGDSTYAQIRLLVEQLAPFDAIFIDANHTEAYVRQDWANYGPLGRIVAFHDIGWKARPLAPGKLSIDVPKVWNEIKQGYRFEEIKLEPRDNGIGVLWRC